MSVGEVPDLVLCGKQFVELCFIVVFIEHHILCAILVDAVTGEEMDYEVVLVFVSVEYFVDLLVVFLQDRELGIPHIPVLVIFRDTILAESFLKSLTVIKGCIDVIIEWLDLVSNMTFVVNSVIVLLCKVNDNHLVCSEEVLLHLLIDISGFRH